MLPARQDSQAGQAGRPGGQAGQVGKWLQSQQRVCAALWVCQLYASKQAGFSIATDEHHCSRVCLRAGPGWPYLLLSPARYFANAERVRRERQLSASMSATWRSEGASTALAQLCSTLTPMSLQWVMGVQAMGKGKRRQLVS